MLSRALTALCNLAPGWKNAGGNDPAEKLNPERFQGVAVERGRAAWVRGHFSDVEVKGRKTAIGCYHRNLALAIMQTSALTALLTRANEVLGDAQGRVAADSARRCGPAISC